MFKTVIHYDRIIYMFRNNSRNQTKLHLVTVDMSTGLNIFTARRYVQARSLLWPGVRPSVCLAFAHSIQTAEDIAKLLCRPGSPIILAY